MLRPLYVRIRSYSYEFHEVEEFQSLIFDFRIVYKSSSIILYTSDMAMSCSFFKPAYYVAAHATILQLSFSHCIQTNYFPSYFFVCIYLPRRLWSCFSSSKNYYIPTILHFIQVLSYVTTSYILPYDVCMRNNNIIFIILIMILLD